MRKINSIKKYLFFFLFVFVAGCAPQAQGPAFKKALAPAGDRGLVYIYGTGRNISVAEGGSATYTDIIEEFYNLTKFTTK